MAEIFCQPDLKKYDIMNFKSLLFTLLMSVMSLSLSAVDYVNVGFCDNTSSIGDTKIELEATPGNYSAAIKLTAADLAMYTDAQFKGVNVGLKSNLQVKSISVWVRESLDGENLASATKTKDNSDVIYSGWNEVLFTSPFNIVSGKDYYVGYDVVMGINNAYLGVQRSIKHEGGNYLKLGNKEWKDKVSDFGVLTLEAFVSAANLPQYNLSLLSATMTEEHISKDSPVTVRYRVKNSGLKDVTSFKITIEDKKKGVIQSNNVTCKLAYGKAADFTQVFNLDNLTDGYYNFTVRVEKPNNEDDEATVDNEITLPEVEYSSKTFRRTVVIEEFTTENCPNCPRAITALKQAYNSLTADQKERVAIVCNHSGYYTDPFTQPCDNSYERFYGGATFAPAMMVDRVKHSQKQAPAFSVPDASGIKNEIISRQDVPANYMLEISGDVDKSTRTVNLTIEMEKAANTLSNPRIVVYLLEDEVLASANGAGQRGGTPPFYHSHVKRAYNSTWGAEIKWDAQNKCTYTCELKYTSACNEDNMEIVAMISNYDANDINNCEVGNAAKVKLNELKVNGESTYTVTAKPNNADMGTVTGGGAYKKGETATLTAIANEGFHFVKWKDGDTENPRTITVTKDITLTAEFAKNGGVAVDNVSGKDIVVTADNGVITVYGAEGANVTVYDMQGNCVYNAAGNEPAEINVPATGVYLVKVEGTTAKVSVR